VSLIHFNVLSPTIPVLAVKRSPRSDHIQSPRNDKPGDSPRDGSCVAMRISDDSETRHDIRGVLVEMEDGTFVVKQVGKPWEDLEPEMGDLTVIPDKRVMDRRTKILINWVRDGGEISN